MKKVLALILTSILGAALLVGCAQRQTPSQATTVSPQAGGSQALTKIVISEFRNLSWSAVYVAFQNGYFKEQGLAPEFAKYDDGPIAFQGMHRGDSQFCLLSQEPVLKAQQEGLKSSIVYSILDTRLYAFISDSGIKSVKELKGQAIFGGMPGSAPYSFVSSILREAGLDPQKDVTFVNLTYGASMAALTRGDIKASYVNIDNRIELKNMKVNVLVDTSKAEDSAKYLKSPVFSGEIITTTADFAQKNPQTVQAFVNAVSKGTIWIREHKAAEVAKLIAPLFGGAAEDVLAQKIEILQGAITKTGMITEASQTAVEDFCISAGVINKQIPYGDIIDMKFVKAVK